MAAAAIQPVIVDCDAKVAGLLGDDRDGTAISRAGWRVGSGQPQGIFPAVDAIVSFVRITKIMIFFRVC